jgi:predicted transcriptional regulator
MGSAKEVVRKLLKEIPDESTLEDIQYHIYVLEKVEKGLSDAKEGKVLSQAEVKKRMSKWLVK